QLGLKLTPQIVNTRGTARYVATITNSGINSQVLDVHVADPDQALIARCEPDRINVGPLQTRKVRLAVRPRRRPLVAPPTTYNFTVQAVPTDAASPDLTAPLLGAPGPLTYAAPLAFLAPLPPRLRALFLALAALALLLALLALLLSQPG